ncbi:hypothetical protein ACIBF5_01180 [Micromonospora sp. NPDC050417]|uniref:hypothetical protein n=1 Tax=Micromonospora sp. NPDC050417 TaxID=3364280 RepID=UPI0037B35CFC
MSLFAVDRRFRLGQDCAPVIRFVAEVRERYDHSGVEINPATAESLIQATLGRHPPPSMERHHHRRPDHVGRRPARRRGSPPPS